MCSTLRRTVANFQTRNFTEFAYSRLLITLVQGHEEKQVIMHQTLAPSHRWHPKGHGVANKTLPIASVGRVSLALQNRDSGITHVQCSTQQMLPLPIRYIKTDQLFTITNT